MNRAAVTLANMERDGRVEIGLVGVSHAFDNK